MKSLISTILFLFSFSLFAQAPKSEKAVKAPKGEAKKQETSDKGKTISTEAKGAGVIKTTPAGSNVPPLPSVGKTKEDAKPGEKGESAKNIPLKDVDESELQDLISFKSNFEKDVKCVKLPPNAKINIDFEDAPLQDVVKFFACIMEKNFIISANIKGGRTITIMSPNPVTVYEAYKAFLSALDVNNLTIVPSGKFLKIVESAKAKTDTIPVFSSGTTIPDEDKIVTAIIQLNHVDIKDLEVVLNKFKSQIGDITGYLPTNTLIITDTGSNIKRLKKFIKELDIPTGKEKIWIRPVEYASASEIASLLLNVFGDKGGKAGTTTRPATGPPGQPGVPAMTVGDTGIEGVAKVSKILQDERTNQLIILATPTAYLKIDKLIRKLDVPIKGEGQIHIYRLENADAEEIAQTLSNLTAGGGPRKGGKGGKVAAAHQPPGGPQPAGMGTAAIFAGEVKITAHKPTNTLVIESSLKDFMSLKKVIQELDVRRKQVYVEAIIMEISSNKERKIGISGSGGTTFNIGGDEVPLIFGLGGLGISGFDMQQLFKGGIAIGLQGPLLDISTGTTDTRTTAGSLAIPTYGFLLQALQSNSDVNILSTPHILTMDNEEAEITVGKQIPFQAQSFGGFPGLYGHGFPGPLGGTTTPTTQETGVLAGLATTLGYGGFGGFGLGGYVQRIDVDLNLKITPQISENNFVKLQIEQSVDDVEAMDVFLGPTTSKRKVTNTVVVKDQQPVVVGGLIRDIESDAVDKVPFFGDIPVFGILFRKSSKRLEKRNLLMIITPYIIEDPSDLKRIHEQKMKEMKEFAEFLATKEKERKGEIDYRKKTGILESMRDIVEKHRKNRELLEQTGFEQVEEVGPPESHDLDYDPFSAYTEDVETIAVEKSVQHGETVMTETAGEKK